MTDSPDFSNVKDDAFLRTLRNARSCGFDLVCAGCGAGINDDSDWEDGHELFCPLSPKLEADQEMAARWAEKQRGAEAPPS